MAWSSPVQAGCRPTSNFGKRGSSFHAGDDYAPPKTGQQGVPVHAIGDGTVIGVGSNLLAGHSGDRNVLIQHPGNIFSYFGHLNSNSVSKGQKVKGGQVIGVMGYRGNTIPAGPNGTHLHLGIIVGGKFVDPSVWLAGKGISVGETAPVKASAPKPKPKPPAKRTTLKRGMKGEDVKDLQRALNNFKATPDKRWPNGDLKVDGDYGSYTEARVKDLQRRNGLYVDGIAGPKTRKFLGL